MKLDATLQKVRSQRERGKPWLALNILDRALLAEQQKKHYRGVILCLVERTIIWRHLFEADCDALYAIWARIDAEAALELVKQFGVVDKLHTAYYILGHAALLFQEYDQAENYFFKSLRYFKGSPAEKGSWRYHLAKALYLTGEKKRALFVFSQAIMEIKKYGPAGDSFLYHVYLSGAYLNFAEVLRKDDKKEAKKYLALAQEIIKKDKRLVVRKRQYSAVAKLFVR